MGNRITLRQAMLRILKQAESTENSVDSHPLTINENVRENLDSVAHVSDSREQSNKGTIRWSNVLNHALFRSGKHRYVMLKPK